MPPAFHDSPDRSGGGTQALQRDAFSFQLRRDKIKRTWTGQSLVAATGLYELPAGSANPTFSTGGNQTRSFCYVEDLIDGLRAMMRQDTEIGPLDLGNSFEVTIRQFVETVLHLTGSKSDWFPAPYLGTTGYSDNRTSVCPNKPSTGRSRWR